MIVQPVVEPMDRFTALIQAGDSKTSMAGINQFVSFLSDKEDSRK